MNKNGNEVVKRMVIKTFHTTYAVIHSSKSDKQMPVYLCREESSGALFHLFAMQKRFLKDTTILFLQEQQKSKDFADFHDMFLYEDSLYVAMRYYSEPSLNTLMEQKHFLEWEERFELGRKILEQIILTKMPQYFRCNCLKLENILVTESLDIHFSYSLDDIELAGGMSKNMYWKALVELFSYLWQEELKRESIPQMKEFFLYLEQDEEKTDEDIYRKYLEIRDTLIKYSKEERKKSNRKLAVFLKKAKKAIPKVLPILAYLILVAAVGYLFYTIWEMVQPTEEALEQFQYIGRLDLKK